MNRRKRYQDNYKNDTDCEKGSFHGRLPPNVKSSATTATGRADGNPDGPPPFAAAPG
jgi:hypothetical protein